jgi:hypothetical protein
VWIKHGKNPGLSSVSDFSEKPRNYSLADRRSRDAAFTVPVTKADPPSAHVPRLFLSGHY